MRSLSCGALIAETRPASSRRSRLTFAGGNRQSAIMVAQQVETGQRLLVVGEGVLARVGE